MILILDNSSPCIQLKTSRYGLCVRARAPAVTLCPTVETVPISGIRLHQLSSNQIIKFNPIHSWIILFFFSSSDFRRIYPVLSGLFWYDMTIFYGPLFIHCFLFRPVSFCNINLFLFLIWYFNIWPALSCFPFDLVISCLPFQFTHLTRQYPACPVLFLIWHGNICPGMSCFIFHLVISRLSYLVFN